jgi:hypothetical protein
MFIMILSFFNVLFVRLSLKSSKLTTCKYSIQNNPAGNKVMFFLCSTMKMLKELALPANKNKSWLKYSQGKWMI